MRQSRHVDEREEAEYHERITVPYCKVLMRTHASYFERILLLHNASASAFHKTTLD
jgi:hypothetical protein